MAMMDAKCVFIDTNVLIRATIDTAPQHEDARRRIEELRVAGYELWINRQVLREYLAVLSRTQPYTSPLPAAELAEDIRHFQTQFHVADEDARVTDRLLALIERVAVGGKQMHDANIVATMQVYTIDTLLTHNVDDFARFADEIIVLPLVES